MSRRPDREACPRLNPRMDHRGSNLNPFPGLDVVEEEQGGMGLRLNIRILPRSIRVLRFPRSRGIRSVGSVDPHGDAGGYLLDRKGILIYGR